MKKLQHPYPVNYAAMVLTLTVTLGWLAAPAAHGYELIDLGTDITPTDINNNGTVVGTRLNGTSKIAIRIPAEGSVEDLPGGVIANAINDNEIITGNTLTGAFVYDGSLKNIGDGTTGGDINMLNQIAGSEAGTNPFRATPLPVNPALYELDANGQKWQVLDVANVYPRGTRQGVYADLYYLLGINDAGYSVGRKSRYGLVGSSAFLITPEFKNVSFLPIPSGGSAVAINNFNRVVGTNGESRAYLYDFEGDAYLDLGTLYGGLRSSAADINDRDQIVGSAWLSTVNTSLVDPTLYHAFIWDGENGMVDLNDLVDAPDWILTAATAINEQGDIVGTGIVNGQVHGFLLSTGVAPPPAENQPPVAVIDTSATSGRAPLTVDFSAVNSYDPDDDTSGYEWDFGDGSTGVGVATTHTYADPGLYLATLTVTDGGNLTDTAQIEITVRKGRRRK